MNQDSDYVVEYLLKNNFGSEYEDQTIRLYQEKFGKVAADQMRKRLKERK